MLLRYVAAVLDQHGPVAAAGMLVNMTEPNLAEPGDLAQVNTAFAETDRRGFSGRFPHLLLDAHYWFPFQRSMMIEETNWEGKIERYGSSIRLLEELKAVKSFITGALPAVGTIPAADQDVLSAAWETSEAVLRPCMSAIDKRVPLWTPG